MRSFILSLTSLFVLFGCTQQPKPAINEVNTHVEITKDSIANNLSEASFSISGMTCKMGCAKTIEKNLSKMEGVQQASVDFETSLATVLYNSSIVQTDDFIQTVINTGDTYKVSEMKNSSSKKSSCCAKEGCTKAQCSKKKS
jgi:Cu+-exporting ATPase